MRGREADGQVDAPAYREFLSDALIRHLAPRFAPVEGVPGLLQIGACGGLENPQSLAFLCELHDAVKDELGKALRRRAADRAFIDERTRACFELNRALNIDFKEPDYRTILGQEDADGRVVVGPRNESFCRARGGAGDAVAPIPEFLRGHHVTLFGPPDDAKLSINAMNAFHRRLEGEPAIVAALLKDSDATAKWGADDEDSKTPLREDLARAGENLTGCLRGSIAYADPASGRTYELAPDHRSVPIKRFPGLAMPCPFLWRRGNPLPLHLYDFALHLFANWDNPRALAFYVPKLENEEEAAYIKLMVTQAERMIQRLHPRYGAGTVRLMLVLENPRAVFRVHEMIDALHPHFAGASLGWHDYLASTARLMKEDANYRIPVKADPNIVIKHIKASHDLLAQVVGSRGGIKVGGMYGVLPSDNRLHGESFQIAIRGFFRDVITQLKRGLDGFWVAHPDFVRIGLALVEAWERHRIGRCEPLEELVNSFLLPAHRRPMLDFIRGGDVKGLDPRDPLFPRALLAADARSDALIANNDPEEIRYNIFQSLQYLTDWLCGNGCVALPATIDGVAIRVMDDLATAERSRWEVWHELRHGRFAVEDFVRIAHEEMHFIRRDLSAPGKAVQVKWDERTRKWYPVAMHLMMKLMSDGEPVEFASQLLLPFTLHSIRDRADPLQAAMEIDPGKFALDARVARCDRYFSACGSRAFLRAMAGNPVMDLQAARDAVMKFTAADVKEAAGFHGDIGEGARQLDAQATREQSLVAGDARQTRERLLELGRRYREKFSFKFLIAASGKSGAQMLEALQARLDNSAEAELQNAREALWTIARGRLLDRPMDSVNEDILRACVARKVTGLTVCVTAPGCPPQTLCFGEAATGRPVTRETCFEIASLSKSLAACIAMEYFRKADIPLTASVQDLLAGSGSPFRLRATNGGDPGWARRVTLAHLLSHEALNLHYVNGVSPRTRMPDLAELLDGNSKFGYLPVEVIAPPGEKFNYSGAGFMVLQHLIEAREGKPIHQVTRPFIEALGLTGLTFEQGPGTGLECADGFTDAGARLPDGRKFFPAFAAGAIASADSVARFLVALAGAHRNLDGCGPIAHDTAVRMLHGVDHGSRQFMGCDMGLGIFTVEAGANRFCAHQGANDGFRALFLHCYAGPDAGKGVVILCNGEQNAVPCVAEAARIALDHLYIEGIDWSRLGPAVDPAKLPAEQRVNAGYRDLIFAAFEPDMPEAIVRHGPRDPLADFNRAVGARIVEVSNQRFARAENLISPCLPTFDPALFGRQGKIMDSWETVRHNPRGRDWLVLELKSPAAVDCVAVSTQFHLGNQAEAFELEGWSDARGQWRTIVAKTPLAGHSFHAFESAAKTEAFHRIRASMYPDGGLTRLALFAADLPAAERGKLFREPRRGFPPFDAQTRKPLAPQFAAGGAPRSAPRNHAAGSPASSGRDGARVDLACSAHGGEVVSASNQHYGAAAQVISPYPPLHMFDGLESARSREPDHSENVVIRLARPARVGRVEIDFTHFVNNNPRDISVDGRVDGTWTTLVPRTPVKAYAGNAIAFAVGGQGTCDQIRVTAFPDGGMNRVRVFAAGAGG